MKYNNLFSCSLNQHATTAITFQVFFPDSIIHYLYFAWLKEVLMMNTIKHIALTRPRRLPWFWMVSRYAETDLLKSLKSSIWLKYKCPNFNINMQHMSYKERLHLCLPTLVYKRMRGDMVEVFKTMNNMYDPEVSSRPGQSPHEAFWCSILQATYRNIQEAV